MNRLFIGLGTIACLGFITTPAAAANGSIAATMARDYWAASARRIEAQARPPVVAKADVAVPRPADPPRRGR